MKLDKESLVGKDIFLSTKLTSSLGMLSIQFVSLEYSIMETISILMSSVDKNLTIRLLSGDSFKVLLSKFKKILLYKINDKDLIKKFNVIHEELNKINDKRNGFIHAIWTIDDKNNITRFKYKSNIKKDPSIIEKEQKDLIEIEKFISRIEDSIKSLSSFDAKIKSMSI